MAVDVETVAADITRIGLSACFRTGKTELVIVYLADAICAVDGSQATALTEAVVLCPHDAESNSVVFFSTLFNCSQDVQLTW